MLISLRFLRVELLHPTPRAPAGLRGLAEGFRYVRGRPDIIVILVMVFSIGTFGLNFPIFISTMVKTVFDQGAAQYGILSSVMAIGSVVGALLSARRDKPRLAMLFVGARSSASDARWPRSPRPTGCSGSP